MRSMLKAIVAVSIFTNLGACQVSVKERAFRTSIPDIPMNRELHFWNPKTRFVVGEPISLILENSSPNRIGIPIEGGMLMLVFEQGEWTNLSNLASYYPPEGEIGVPPGGLEDPPLASIDVVPDLQGGGQVVHVRVVVVGRIYNGEMMTDQRTGAFIDVAMYP